MNYFEFHIGDYQTRTAHLTLAEHGAYVLMLQQYCATEQPLPKSWPNLSRILRLSSKSERRAVESVLAQYWTLTDEGYVNKRAMQVIEEYRKWVTQQKANGSKGGRPKKTQTKPNGFPTETQTQTQTKAKRGDSHFPPPTSQVEVLDSPSQDTHSVPLSSASAITRVQVDPDALREVQARYPAGTYRQSDWLLAEREIRSRLEEGDSVGEMLAGVERYRTQAAARGSTGTQFVLSPRRFFAERQYREPFPLPATKAEQRLGANLDAAAEFMRRTEEPAA